MDPLPPPNDPPTQTEGAKPPLNPLVYPLLIIFGILNTWALDYRREQKAGEREQANERRHQELKALLVEREPKK